MRGIIYKPPFHCPLSKRRVTHVAVVGSRSRVQDDYTLRRNEAPCLRAGHALGRWTRLSDCTCRGSRDDKRDTRTRFIAADSPEKMCAVNSSISGMSAHTNETPDFCRPVMK